MYATADATISSQNKCIKKVNQVYDCLKYGVDGTCFCEAIVDSKWVPSIIKDATGTKAWGCVPIAQNKINGICTYKSAKQYDCLCSHKDYKFDIRMDTTDSNN